MKDRVYNLASESYQRIPDMYESREVFWGIDVSKAWIDISINQQVTRVKSTQQAIRAFIKQHAQHPSNTLAIVESTGGYERLTVECLTSMGICTHVAHPNRVREYAKARGHLAKSDALDARIIEGYARFMDPKMLHALPTRIERELRDLSSRLAQLKRLHHQESCRLGQAHSTSVQRSHKQMLSMLKRQMATIEDQILSMIKADVGLTKRYRGLQSMKGVGPTVAMKVVCDLPELGRIDKKAIASLVGVAPMTRESGKYKGRSMTANGRSGVRKGLYMAALTAIRHDEKMREFYNGLLSKGKVKKVALVAVMRKMLVILNAMIMSDTLYQA